MLDSFEIDDTKLLLGSGLAAVAYGATAFAVPKKFHDLHMEVTEACSEPAWRWFGLAAACSGSNTIVLSASDPNKKAVKNSLKAAGVGWLAVSALTAYNVKEQSQKADVGLAGAAAQAALGVLCLWRGMSD